MAGSSSRTAARAARFGAIACLCGWIVACAAAHAAELSLSPQSSADLPARPGKWTTYRVAIGNEGAERAQTETATFAAHAPLRQFGRTTSAPPRAVRRVAHPLWLAPPPDGSAQVTLRSQLFVADQSDQDEGRDRSSPTLQRESTLPLETDVHVTGVLADDPTARRAVQWAKVLAGGGPRLYDFSESWSLPAAVDAWGALDSVAVASSRLLDDPAALAALRQWLHQGGRVWLMLDRIDPALPNALLGDAWTASVLERCDVATVEFRVPPRTGAEPAAAAVEVDPPAPLVRLDCSGAEVQWQAGDWPAAFWLRAGDGWVLCTTLGPSAWLAGWEGAGAADPADARQAQAVRASRGRLPLAALGRRFFRPAATARLPVAELAQTSSQQLGYRTPSRRLMAAVLGAACLGVGGVVLTLHRTGRAWRALLAGPALALVAAATLVGLGQSYRGAVPDAYASTELVRLFPRVGEFATTSGLAVYRGASSTETASGRGPACRLFPSGGEAALQRLVWTDVDAWRLGPLLLPAGVTTGAWQGAGKLGPQASVAAALTSRGLEGRLRLPVELVEGPAAIVSGRGPALTAALASDGTFVAAASDELPPARMTRVPLLDDRTRQRERLMQQVAQALAADPPPHAALLCWTRPWLSDLSLASSTTRLGESLALVPLPLDRPAPGVELAIPALLTPYESVASPDGQPPTSAFSNETRSWVEGMATRTLATLRFQFPPELLPLRLSAARLTAEVHAPGRTIRWLGWQGPAPREAARFDQPDGRPLTVVFDDASMLGLDSAGGLSISLEVGPHPREASGSLAQSGWRVDRVSLQATAVAERP